MITKKDISKMLKHMFKRGGIHTVRLIHPNRDWTLGLIVVTLVFLGGSVYTWNLFVRENRDFDRNVQISNIGAVAYKHDLVREVLDAYQVREDAFEAFRASHTREPRSVATSTKTGEE